MSRISGRVTAVTMAIVLAASIAGCGSSKKSSTKAPGGTKGTINIGVVCTCSGPFAGSIGPMPAGVQAWSQDVNARGGINGHRVSIVLKDDAGDPAKSVAAVKSLVEDSHVVALMSLSTLDSTWSAYVSQAKVPVVGANSTEQIFEQNPYFFSQGLTASSLATAQITAAKKAGAKKLAIFYCAEAPICARSIGAQKAAAGDAGVDLVLSAAISAAQPSYTAQCLSARDKGADAMVIAHDIRVGERMAADCLQQGYKPTQVQGSQAVAGLAKLPAFDNRTVAWQPNFPAFVYSTPASKQMRAALQKYEPQALNSPSYSDLVVQSWTAGLLIEKAAVAGKLGVGGTATPAQLLDGLYTLKGETLGGMAPPLTFERGKPNPVRCWFMSRISHGEYTTPFGVGPICKG